MPDNTPIQTVPPFIGVLKQTIKPISPPRHRLRIVFIFILLLSSSLPPTTRQCSAKNTISPTHLNHRPVASASAGRLIPVTVEVKNPDEIILVRLYFKTMASKWYVYLEMTANGKNRFTAAIPPTKNDTKGIDYIILIENSKGETVKSRAQRILILNDYFPPQSPVNSYEVMTEYTTPPPELLDFSVPLHIIPTREHKLADAQPYLYPPIAVPGPAGKKPNGSLSGLTGIVFSIGIGNVGIHYSSSSGQ